MSAVLNDRDAILQAAGVRIVNPKNASILLSLSAPLFHLDAAGVADVASITITATLVGLEGDLTFSAEGATLTAVTGKSAAVKRTDMQGPTAVVTASITTGGETFKQSCIIATVQDGADGGAGARGAGMYFATGNTWSDGVADNATPGGNVAGDVVTITNGTTYSLTKKWSGTAWVAMGAVFEGSLFVTGSIGTTALAAQAVTAEKLAAGAVTARSLAVGGDQNNLIRDPRFKDLAWWGVPADRVGVFDHYEINPTAPVVWKHGASMYFKPNGYVQLNYLSSPIPIVPGATYLIEYMLYFSDDWYGELNVEWHWPSVAWYQNGVPSSGFTWDGTHPIQYPSNSRGLKSIVHTVTVPNDSRLVNSQIMFRTRISTGTVEVGGFTITRVMDNVLIKDGAVTAQKILAQNLAAIVAYLGSCEIGAGGSLRQGQTGYDVGQGFFLGAGQDGSAKMSMAAGTSKVLLDPANGVLKLINPQTQNSFSASLTNTVMNNQVNTQTYQSYSKNPTLSNGTPAYRYSWNFTVEQGDIFMASSPSDATLVLRARGWNAVCSGFVSLTVVDQNGATDYASCRVSIQFGSGVAV